MSIADRPQYRHVPWPMIMQTDPINDVHFSIHHATVQDKTKSFSVTLFRKLNQKALNILCKLAQTEMSFWGYNNTEFIHKQKLQLNLQFYKFLNTLLEIIASGLIGSVDYGHWKSSCHSVQCTQLIILCSYKLYKRNFLCKYVKSSNVICRLFVNDANEECAMLPRQ